MEKTLTIASLAISVYLTGFYIPDNTPIPNVSGDLEKRIRSAYYGGVTTKYVYRIDNCYNYDMVSEYPAAMLIDIPVGPPVGVATLYSLDRFYGFVYCKVTAP